MSRELATHLPVEKKKVSHSFNLCGLIPRSLLRKNYSQTSHGSISLTMTLSLIEGSKSVIPECSYRVRHRASDGSVLRRKSRRNYDWTPDKNIRG